MRQIGNYINVQKKIRDLVDNSVILWLGCLQGGWSRDDSGKAGLSDAVESVECHNKSGISCAGEGATEHLKLLSLPHLLPRRIALVAISSSGWSVCMAGSWGGGSSGATPQCSVGSRLCLCRK